MGARTGNPGDARKERLGTYYCIRLRVTIFTATLLVIIREMALPETEERTARPQGSYQKARDANETSDQVFSWQRTDHGNPLPALPVRIRHLFRRTDLGQNAPCLSSIADF
jgi:hypothetical protein